MAHEDYKEMLPALALSALDPGEERALNEHLAHCDECRKELANWESTAASLAFNAAPAEPSPQVRDRIISAVRSEKQRQPRGESTQSRVVEFPPSRRATWTSFGRVGAVAAAVLFLFLILWIVVLWQQNRSLRQRNEDLASTFNSMSREVNGLSQFVEIMKTPGARVTQLQGSGEGAGASGELVYDPSGRAMLMAQGLPPAPKGKEYQLWFIVGNNPLPGRTFAPYEMGRGEVIDQIPSRARNNAVFAVTLEPAGGNISPTGAIYLRSGL
jgi:anti-sigma-K factor RskA